MLINIVAILDATRSMKLMKSISDYRGNSDESRERLNDSP